MSDATALRTAIERLSLQGAIFLRGEYREPGPRHWAAAGDVIVLPYGDQHRMGA